jgi:Protein of unknown function (DUF2958)
MSGVHHAPAFGVFVSGNKPLLASCLHAKVLRLSHPHPHLFPDPHAPTFTKRTPPDMTEPLLPDALRRSLPPLYSTENDPDPVVRAKFFHPAGRWTWYVLEFDSDDLFFGLVDGFEREFGYFSLAELGSVCVNGLGIERDLSFKPCRVSELPGGEACRTHPSADRTRVRDSR